MRQHYKQDHCRDRRWLRHAALDSSLPRARRAEHRVKKRGRFTQRKAQDINKSRSAQKSSMSDSIGAARYKTACKRLYAHADPAYLRALNGEHDGEFSTGDVASAAFDRDGVFALVSTLEMCRNLHTLRLVGLQRGGVPLLQRDVLGTAIVAVRTSPSIKIFDLSSNALTDEIASAPITKLLLQNTTLTCLSLAHNSLGLQTARALLAHLPTNKTLVDLDIAANPDFKWPGQAKEYEKLFLHNTSLHSFSASVAEPVAAAVLGVVVRTPARMRRLGLSRASLADSQVSRPSLPAVAARHHAHAAPSAPL